jgi:hypothetical protein
VSVQEQMKESASELYDKMQSFVGAYILELETPTVNMFYKMLFALRLIAAGRKRFDP